MNGKRRVVVIYTLTIMGAGGLCLAVVRVPSMHHCFVEAAILGLYGINASQLEQYTKEAEHVKRAMQYVFDQVCFSYSH